LKTPKRKKSEKSSIAMILLFSVFAQLDTLFSIFAQLNWECTKFENVQNSRNGSKTMQKVLANNADKPIHCTAAGCVSCCLMSKNLKTFFLLVPDPDDTGCCPSLEHLDVMNRLHKNTQAPATEASGSTQGRN
jgi:hypothetical protein